MFLLQNCICHCYLFGCLLLESLELSLFIWGPFDSHSRFLESENRDLSICAAIFICCIICSMLMLIVPVKGNFIEARMFIVFVVQWQYFYLDLGKIKYFIFSRIRLSSICFLSLLFLWNYSRIYKHLQLDAQN